MVNPNQTHIFLFAFRYLPRKPALAPFYDLICTMVYENLTDNLAMKIGAEKRIGWLAPRHF